MRRILFTVAALGLATMTAACGVSSRTNYAYAPPGATYSGDRYYDGYTYRNYPSQAVVYQSNPNPYPSTTGYYYSEGDYYRNYRGIHSAPERNM
jgi:hypothetical protein